MSSWALVLHLLSAVVWVGGMFFAYLALRPAAAETLQGPQRLPLWSATLRRFFFWVWIAVVALPATGLYMVAQRGGFAAVPHAVLLMAVIGVVMILIFGYVYFLPYLRLVRHSALHDWEEAGRALKQIRLLVALNLVLGLINISLIKLMA